MMPHGPAYSMCMQCMHLDRTHLCACQCYVCVFDFSTHSHALTINYHRLMKEMCDALYVPEYDSPVCLSIPCMCVWFSTHMYLTLLTIAGLMKDMCDAFLTPLMI